jgi:integrase
MPRRARSRGHIEERPGGKLRVRVYAGRDPLTGRERYLKKTVDDEKQAEAALTKLLNQVDEQRHPRTQVTVRQVIAKWFEVVVHQESTRTKNEQLVRDYIEPSLGKLQAGKLDAELIETFYAKLLKCRKLCNGRHSADHECTPLSSSSVRQIHAILRGSLDRAVRWQYMSLNPAALAEPPGLKPPQPDPPSPEEAAAVLNEAWMDPAWGMLLWLVMVTGCRRGELCAVRWTDVQLVRGSLMVGRALTRQLSEKRTKSSQQRRVSLDSYTVELLQAYKARCEEQCRSLGTKLARTAFVFSNAPDFSEPIKPDTVTQRYRRLAQRNGLRSTRFHALRHYSATELLSSGVDLRTASGRLGHGTGATTLRFYAAWVNEADSRAADAIAKVMPRPVAGRHSPQNPYEDVAAKLRAAIADGTYGVGTALPRRSSWLDTTTSPLER